jgi:hypothetical protein
VPRRLANGSTQWAAIPLRMRRWIGRRTRHDAMFIDIDPEARASYEERTTG